MIHKIDEVKILLDKNNYYVGDLISGSVQVKVAQMASWEVC
jgi:hypothetical protein